MKVSISYTASFTRTQKAPRFENNHTVGVGCNHGDNMPPRPPENVLEGHATFNHVK